MTAIAHEVQQAHQQRTSISCTCDARDDGRPGWWTRHIATTTEELVRERIAADIEDERMPRHWERNDVLDMAARIARRGGESS